MRKFGLGGKSGVYGALTFDIKHNFILKEKEMNTEKSLEIIRTLTDGFDPQTGEIFSPESAYQHPQTVRALFVAIQALEHVKKSEDRLKRFPEKAGKAWDEAEDKLLILAYNSGKAVKQLAEEHQRTKSAIVLRLIKYEKIKL